MKVYGEDGLTDPLASLIRFVFGSSYSAIPGMKGRCCTEAGEGGASFVVVAAFGGMADGGGRVGDDECGELTTGDERDASGRRVF